MTREVMSWWRAYHGLPSHPKWLEIARRSGQPIPVVFSVAMWLLDFGSKAASRGCVEAFEPGPCAAFLWIDEESVTSVMEAMAATGWLSDDRISSWEERQPNREDVTAAERKRAQRKREKTDDVTQRHAASRNDTPREEKSREDKKREDSSSLHDEQSRSRAKPFDDFWEAYPHKVGKPAAKKSFDRVCKGGAVSLEVMLGGIVRYRASKPPDRNWLNPATWLNQHRWEDQPAEVARGSPSRTSGPSMADIATSDIPLRHSNEPRADTTRETAPKPNTSDPPRKGFAGRISFADRANGNGEVLNLRVVGSEG